MCLSAASQKDWPFENAPDDLYEYHPLPAKSSFRLLELAPGQEEDYISYKLHLTDIGSSRSYEALSYTWNDPKTKVPTICDGKVLHITPNLYAALGALRLLHEPRWLWADAICINQQDVGERSEQVRHMLEIYRSSSGVVVWLGLDETNDSGSSIAETAKQCIDETTLELVHRNVDLLWTQPSAISDDEHDLDFTKPMPPDRNQRIELVLKNLHSLNDLFSLTRHDSPSLYRHPGLPALVWFYSRPWFQRLWVIQEVNANTNVNVLCGNVTVSWARVGLIAAFVKTIYFFFGDIEVQFRNSFLENADLMRNRAALQSWSIYQVMSGTSEFCATDPRDHIYGKLGLRAFARSGLHVEADYNKTVKDVYRDFAVLGMNHFANLDILSFAGHKAGLRVDLPSWIPQWNKGSARQHVLQLFANSTWNANKGIPLETPARICNDSLLLNGVVLDKIRGLIAIDATEWRRNELSKSNPLYQLWQQEHTTNESEGVGQASRKQSRFWACAASMLAGFDFSHRFVTETWDEFQASTLTFIDFIASSLDHCDPPSPDLSTKNAWFEYRYNAHRFGQGRVLFETSSGHVGLGPESLMKDDLVCVPYGGRVPYILHPEEDHFSLVGESYVHGFMNGEAVGMLQAGEMEEQKFEIR